MRKQILFTKQALKFLNGLPEAVQDEFYADFDTLRENGRLEFTKEEARKACEEWMAKAAKRPGAQAALRRVRAQQKAARALRRMREHAALTQSEIARRMDVKTTAVSRLERVGASTLQALFGYAKACGYTICITAKSKQDQFAFA